MDNKTLKKALGAGVLLGIANDKRKAEKQGKKSNPVKSAVKWGSAMGVAYWLLKDEKDLYKKF